MKSAERSIGDYGLDAPRVVRTVGVLGALALLATVVAGIVNALPAMAAAFASTVVIALVGLWMVRASRVRKLRQRVRLVDRLELSGDERVLDVGYGRGLLLIEAAHRVGDGGRAVGIDVWRTEEHSGNHPDAALDNADAEGVNERVDISIGDARALPFASESFRAVMSSSTPQNVGDHDARVHAIREIDRVLAPGGHFVLLGSRWTRDYVYALRSCNWTEVRRSGPLWRMFPPVRYVMGTKPDPSREVEVAPEVEEAAAEVEAHSEEAATTSEADSDEAAAEIEPEGEDEELTAEGEPEEPHAEEAAADEAAADEAEADEDEADEDEADEAEADEAEADEAAAAEAEADEDEAAAAEAEAGEAEAEEQPAAESATPQDGEDEGPDKEAQEEEEAEAEAPAKVVAEREGDDEGEMSAAAAP